MIDENSWVSYVLANAKVRLSCETVTLDFDDFDLDMVISYN